MRSHGPRGARPWLPLGCIALAAFSGCGIFGSSSDDEGGDSGSPFGSGNAGPRGLGDLEACATSSAAGASAPVRLVVIYDRSGSMGDGQSGDPALKWFPAKEAMNAFFANRASTGISASLEYFPLVEGDRCDETRYASPSIRMTPLPDISTFKRSLEATQPSGDTPTLPALAGSLSYARQIAKREAGSKVAVLVVTDGEPVGCSGNSLGAVVAEAKSGFEGEPSVSTYVVGVGQELGALNGIAEAGGTRRAIIIGAGTAEQTRQELDQALGDVRGRVVSCSLTLPAPPDGKELDTGLVNVVFTPSGGAPAAMPYSATCEGEGAWRYDNPAAPHRVELCPWLCDRVLSDEGAKITLAFGCVTRTSIR